MWSWVFRYSYWLISFEFVFELWKCKQQWSLCSSPHFYQLWIKMKVNDFNCWWICSAFLNCWDNEMFFLAYYEVINLGLFLIKTKSSKPQLSFPSFTVIFTWRVLCALAFWSKCWAWSSVSLLNSLSHCQIIIFSVVIKREHIVKAKLLILVDLHSHPQLWSGVVGSSIMWE